jgi:DeoR/GlpR family transcriptional regulator of sugar metabolism
MSERETLGSRLTSIIIELHQYGAVDRNSLAQKFNVTERTIYRDLNRLGPIIIRTSEGKYSLSIPARKVLDEAIPDQKGK